MLNIFHCLWYPFVFDCIILGNIEKFSAVIHVILCSDWQTIRLICSENNLGWAFHRAPLCSLRGRRAVMWKLSWTFKLWSFMCIVDLSGFLGFFCLPTNAALLQSCFYNQFSFKDIYFLFNSISLFTICWLERQLIENSYILKYLHRSTL